MVKDGLVAIVTFVGGSAARPSFRSNRTLWKRAQNEILRIGHQNVRCKWTKGHATTKMVEDGYVRPENKIGNDAADVLAVRGRLAHGDNEDLKEAMAAARRRSDITMVTQRMLINVLKLRNDLRQIKEDNDEIQTADQVPPVEGPNTRSLDEIFPPREATGGYAAKPSLKSASPMPFGKTSRMRPEIGPWVPSQESLPWVKPAGNTLWNGCLP